MDSPPLLPLIVSARHSSISMLWDWTEAHSRVVRDLDARIKAAQPEGEQAPPICVRYSHDGVEAILTPAYRLLNLETTDPRIVEGERLITAAVNRLNEIAKSNGARLAVVLIPTKESAFRFEPSDPQSEDLRYLTRLWDMEARARHRVSKALETSNITVIDALPPLQALIRVGSDPYLGMDGNGHPSAVGYAAIAKAVATSIEGLLH